MTRTITEKYRLWSLIWPERCRKQLKRWPNGGIRVLELLLDVVKDTRPEDVLVLEVATIGLLVTLGAVVTQNPVLTRIAQGLGVLGLLLLMYFHIG